MSPRVLHRQTHCKSRDVVLRVSRSMDGHLYNTVLMYLIKSTTTALLQNIWPYTSRKYYMLKHCVCCVALSITQLGGIPVLSKIKRGKSSRKKRVLIRYSDFSWNSDVTLPRIENARRHSESHGLPYRRFRSRRRLI